MELSSKLGLGTICVVPLCEELIFNESMCLRQGSQFHTGSRFGFTKRTIYFGTSSYQCTVSELLLYIYIYILINSV